MNRRSNEDGMDKFQRLPFSVLVKKDKNLSGIRSEYALKSKSERRMAADWEYHSEIAGELLSNAMANAGEYESESSYWPSGITALAIDPLYAPAILTVGSLEYMVGRSRCAAEKECNSCLTSLLA